MTQSKIQAQQAINQKIKKKKQYPKSTITNRTKQNADPLTTS